MAQESFDFPPTVIALLTLRDDFVGRRTQIFLRVKENVLVGRDSKRCDISVKDPTVSNKHLRIYSVSCEDGASSSLAYAENVSENVVRLKRANRSATLDNAPPLHYLRREAGAILLHDGDELQISTRIFVQYTEIKREEQSASRPSAIQQAERKAFQHLYTLSNRKLGSGAWGCVHLAYDRISGEQLACKIVDLNSANDDAGTNHSTGVSDREIPSVAMGQVGNNLFSCQKTARFRRLDRALREVRVLKRISHPNIISLDRVFWSDSTIYIFQELVTAGDLFSYVEFHGGRLDGVVGAVIILQILKAVDYLHERNIIHRDLKLENVLMTSLKEGARVVLTDFGHARVVRPDKDSRVPGGLQRLFSTVGTVGYAAPEVYGRNKTMPKANGYSKAVDMWSIGVMTSMMLSGYELFKSSTGSTLSNAAECNLRDLDTAQEWKLVCKNAKHFVKNVLVLDERKRLTAREALRHEWFANRTYAAEFDALYDRSIKTWARRSPGPLLIQRLYTTAAQSVGKTRASLPLCQIAEDAAAGADSLEMSAPLRLPETPVLAAQKRADCATDPPATLAPSALETGKGVCARPIDSQASTIVDNDSGSKCSWDGYVKQEE